MDAVNKIHQFNRFGSRLGLERMTVLLDKLGNPHLDLDVIHVAGTNGKGSVCKFLEEGLGSCGYNVGLYTSPFIEKFNERIRLGGEDISDEDLQRFTEPVLAAADEMVAEGFDSPTEFEVVTAIAFMYFKEKGADITVLEVGLGGIGDSTNVVKKPLVCAITSISFDHMDRLGNTLAEIAGEKAGIIKEGVPVISNVSEREASRVIAKTAYENNSKFYDVSKLDFTVYDTTPFSQKVDMDIYGTDYNDVEISMIGKHQGENLKTALSVIEVLRKERKIKVERSRLYAGLKKAVQPGRLEVVRDEFFDSNGNKLPMVIVDGAHNEAGAEVLARTFKEFFEGQKILLVTGMLADKQVDEILNHFVGITENMIITEPDNPRKLKVEELEATVKKMGVEPIKTKDAREGVAVAEKLQKNYDVILFAGSLYLIGDVRRIMRNEWGKES